MELVIKTFDELTVDELYEILRLRVDVFVVEQRCPYHELDGLDRCALHLFLRDGEGIQGCLRVLPAGACFDTAGMGRVAVRRRRQGLGLRLVKAGVKAAWQRLGAGAITLDAQTYARGLYEQAGFRAVSGEFLEDGIPHIRMRLEREAASGEQEEGF